MLSHIKKFFFTGRQFFLVSMFASCVFPLYGVNFSSIIRPGFSKICSAYWYVSNGISSSAMVGLNIKNYVERTALIKSMEFVSERIDNFVKEELKACGAIDIKGIKIKKHNDLCDFRFPSGAQSIPGSGYAYHADTILISVNQEKELDLLLGKIASGLTLGEVELNRFNEHRFLVRHTGLSVVHGGKRLLAFNMLLPVFILAGSLAIRRGLTSALDYSGINEKINNNLFAFCVKETVSSGLIVPLSLFTIEALVPLIYKVHREYSVYYGGDNYGGGSEQLMWYWYYAARVSEPVMFCTEFAWMMLLGGKYYQYRQKYIERFIDPSGKNPEIIQAGKRLLSPGFSRFGFDTFCRETRQDVKQRSRLLGSEKC